LRLVHRTHEELCGGRPGTRLRRRAAVAEVDVAEGHNGRVCEEALLDLSGHGEPQAPPKPEPLEHYPEAPRLPPPAAVNVAVGAVNVAVGAPPHEERSHVAANVPEAVNPMRALRELLEEIRASLDQRFSQLEQRFADYVESADARTTVLEGEVNILSAKVDHVSSTLRDLVPVAAPTSQNGSIGVQTSAASAGKPLLTTPPRLEAAAKSPIWETVGTPPQVKSYSPHLQDAIASGALLERARLSGHMDPRLSPPSATLPTCASPIAASIAGHQYRDEHPLLDSGHHASVNTSQDTESLIEKLTCKFKKTEELLSKAQERVARIAVDGQTTPTAHSPFRDALGGPGVEPVGARHSALGM